MKWTRKAVFDYHEYRAESGNRNFCIDRVGSGWALRGWTDGKFSLYREGKSLRALKALAEGLVKESE